MNAPIISSPSQVVGSSTVKVIWGTISSPSLTGRALLVIPMLFVPLSSFTANAPMVTLT